MVLFIFLGAIIGIFSVVFAMQNTALVTVTFLDWHVAAPLAVIVLGAAVFGIAVTLLTMLIGVISNALMEYRQKRERITTVEVPTREVRETTVEQQIA
jgi:lipopolysaccharide assembly protein A